MSQEQEKNGSKQSVLDADDQEKRYSVGGKILILRPLSIKRFRKLGAIVDEGFRQFSNVDQETIVKNMIEILADKANSIMSVIFDETDHPFMTSEFIEDNFTVPMSRRILEDTMTMNGIDELMPSIKKSMRSSQAKD